MVDPRRAVEMRSRIRRLEPERIGVVHAESEAFSIDQVSTPLLDANTTGSTAHDSPRSIGRRTLNSPSSPSSRVEKEVETELSNEQSAAPSTPMELDSDVDDVQQPGPSRTSNPLTENESQQVLQSRVMQNPPDHGPNIISQQHPGNTTSLPRRGPGPTSTNSTVSAVQNSKRPQSPASVEGARKQRASKGPMSRPGEVNGLSAVSSLPYVQRISYWTSVVGHRIRHINGLRDRGNVEMPRLELLQDACHKADMEYLLVHQLFCWRNLYGPLTNCPYLEGVKQDHDDGLAILEELLSSNEQVSRDGILWFANFPLPLTYPRLKITDIMQAERRTLDVLSHMNKGWKGIKSSYSVHRIPPSCRDITQLLGIYSPVLQQIVFRTLIRTMWIGQRDACMALCENVFIKSQASATHAPNSTTEAPNTTHMDYHQILFQHQNHGELTQHSNQSDCAAHSPSRHQILPFQGSPAQSHLSSSQSTPAPIIPRPAPISTQIMPPSVNSVPLSAPIINRRAFGFGARSVPQSPANSAGLHVLRSNSLSNDEASRQRAQIMLQQTNHSATVQVPIEQSRQVMTSRSPSIPNHLFPYVHMNPPSFGLPAGAGTASTVNISPNNPFVSALQPMPTAQQLIQNTTHAVNRSPSVFVNAPTPNSKYSLPAFPDPALTAIHQAQVKSPRLVPADPNDSRWIAKSSRFVTSFMLSGSLLDKETTYVFCGAVLDRSLIERRAIKYLGPLAMSIRPVTNGSLTFRVRCVEFAEGSETPPKTGWITSETTWPPNIAISVNGIALEIRKKSHHGKDLPVDVTEIVKEGQNEIKSAVLSLPDTRKRYLIGLEAVQVTDESQVRSLVRTESSDDARKRLLSRFQNHDPDIEIIQPHITVDLTDPFTSRIYETPTRSKKCSHIQCFDLDVFLQTRNVSDPLQPCAPEDFKCPICKADARPPLLVIDAFFANIRRSLIEMDRLDAKAVQLKEDGSWVIKEGEASKDNSNDNNTRVARSYVDRQAPVEKQAHRRSTGTVSKNPNVTVETIEILDD